MDGSGGYCRQMERAMERAVSKGLLSPVDFHCRKADMMEALASGLDDGATRTSSKLLYAACSEYVCVSAALLCSSYVQSPAAPLSPVCVGVLRTLSDYYRAENTDCAHVWLSADADHFGSSAGDKGWGCGYRNFQMLLSALHRIETYASVLRGNFHHPLLSPVTSDLSFIRMKRSILMCLSIITEILCDLSVRFKI